ncbi:nucleoid occlusion protein [Chakrabartyella piscis]|uniref:nucleoid occlusion protein n=1 Tax=Chakrabartyella piscis TaxID=2918914 RepID=UPI002958B89E|nr:nucleoid occlusion protein [Chakrabartyella piscis]
MELLKFTERRMKKEKMVYQLPVDKIRPNPYQPRKYFNFNALEELSKSIADYGVLQPISVRKMTGGYYELVAGERRLRGADMAGLTEIPAIVLDITDQDSAILAFIENLQRQNLSFLEEAEGYRNMIEDYGLTQTELAKKLSKSQSAIANKLRVLKLEERVKQELTLYRFSERHARALLRLPDESCRLAILDKMKERDASVKETEEMIEELLDFLEEKAKKPQGKREKRYVADFRIYTNTIKQSVEVIRKSGVEVVYEDTENEDCCEIMIRIQKQEKAAM